METFSHGFERKNKANISAPEAKSNSEFSSQSSSSDEEFNSLTNQIRRRLSALAYKVQLRKDTFRDDESAQEIISIIEKRLKAKKEKEEKEDIEDKIPTRSQKGFLAVILALALLTIAHFTAALYCFTHPDPLEHPNTCLTGNCQRFSDSFKTAMDTDVNPCDDFYLHVCGQFIKDNPAISPMENVKPSFVDGIPYEYDGNHKLGMLLRPVKLYPANQVLPFYKSCIHQKRRDEDGYKPLVEFLAQIGLLEPRRNSTDIPNISRLIASTYKCTGRTFFIDVFETIHNYVAVGISKPPVEFKGVNSTIYADTMRKALKLMQKELRIRDDNELDIIVYVVMRFEAELYTLQSKSDNSASNNVPNIFGFPDNMDQYVRKPKRSSSWFQVPTGRFSWADFIDELFVKDSKDKEKPDFLFNYLYSILSQRDRINILFLEEFLTRTPFYTICRYFQWAIIKELNYDLTTELRGLMRKILPSKGLTDTERCFRSLFANLNVLAAERFIMDMEDFNDVDKKMSDVLNVIMTGLVNVTTKMPQEFHEWMLEKFSSFKVTDSLVRGVSKYISKFYTGLNISEKHYFRNVIQARKIKARNEINRIRKIPPFQDWPLGAFSLNEITMTSIQDENIHQKFLHVPFGGLYEPFVGNDLPILDFGGFGYWIVSFYMMYNTVADMLRYFASERAVHEPKAAVRGEKLMEMVFLPRLECIQEAYSTIELSELPGQKLNDRSHYISLQMFADALAVEVLTKVHALNEKNTDVFPKHQLLPQFEHYSHDKLLFHTIARQSCTSSAESILRYQMNNGPIPYHLRINGAFRLSPIFAKAWNCPENSFMNPISKCEFFGAYKPPATDWLRKAPPGLKHRRENADAQLISLEEILLED
ncbi:unnamed protein product [Allacma fusca]|uniref:Uncharacterized protein n=1 Tax=Allacma fusca TaxID=39272 RepID=A0A8J2LHF0_9HEXA|nr:unnamed protein product [Allacma fusca]